MTSEADREAAVLDRIDAYRKRRPRFTDTVITTAHGAGGKASAALTDAVFLEAFANPTLAQLTDAAVLDVGAGRLAMTTDAYVVRPLRFPGGSIGDLAVNGTVNDLAMAGAVPRWLTASFIIAEGFAVDELRAIVADMARAAAAAGVEIVAGDTKVVDRGAADGLFITTAGVGLVPSGVALGAPEVRAGDRVLVSGTIGDHGVAVLLARGDLALEAEVNSDTAPLHELVRNLLSAVPATRWLRDATRGGVATVCNELAKAAGVGVVLDEAALPVRNPVKGACEILGIDPLYVANEGKLVAVVPAADVDVALAALRAHALGADAAVIGEVVEDSSTLVVLDTAFGGSRIVDMLVGDPLPRIC